MTIKCLHLFKTLTRCRLVTRGFLQLIGILDITLAFSRNRLAKNLEYFDQLFFACALQYERSHSIAIKIKTVPGVCKERLICLYF